MYPDEELIKQVRQLPETERKSNMDLIEEYVLACQLSRGPDPNRSEHWTIKAVELARTLRIRSCAKKEEVKDEKGTG